MQDTVNVPRELLRQVLYPLDLAQALTQKSSHHGTILSAYNQLRALLDAPAVEPYGHVTVRRLSQRFENHVDQYTFYPAGHPPYLDNADECITVYTAPQAQQPANQFNPDWDQVKPFLDRIAELEAQQPAPRKHITDGSPCWCNPESVYTDPETGTSVIVHKEPQ